MLELQRQELAISIDRKQAGGVSDYDLRTQRTAVAQTEAKLPRSSSNSMQSTTNWRS